MLKMERGIFCEVGMVLMCHTRLSMPWAAINEPSLLKPAVACGVRTVHPAGDKTALSHLLVWRFPQPCHNIPNF